MNYIKTFIISLVLCLSLTSCFTETYAQTNDMYDNQVTYTTIVTNGVPYYVNGIISYYFYNGLYYYPYIWNNVRYFYPFTRLQPRGFIYHPGLSHRPYMMLGDNFRRPNVGNRQEHFNIRGNNARPNMRQNNMPNNNQRQGQHQIGNQTNNRGTFSSSVGRQNIQVKPNIGIRQPRTFSNNSRPNTQMRQSSTRFRR